MSSSVHVGEDPIDLSRVVASVSNDAAGAVATFIGTTRDSFHGRRVVRLEYEGYVPMAEKELLKVCARAHERWALLGLNIVHRLGVVRVGEASVVVAASSAHRGDALEATRFCIDELKASVPIWKLEVYDGDERTWKENIEAKTGRRRMVPINDCIGNDTGSTSGNAGVISQEHKTGSSGASGTKRCAMDEQAAPRQKLRKT